MARKLKAANQPDPLMSLPEVADYLQVAERTVYNWAHQGTIPSFKLVGNIWRFKKSDLDAWIETCREQTPRPKAD
tara:strand:+ start:598 stop:822 length:225 start_codon:yes stop_codon:yes gene_type:complete